MILCSFLLICVTDLLHRSNNSFHIWDLAMLREQDVHVDHSGMELLRRKMRTGISLL